MLQDAEEILSVALKRLVAIADVGELSRDLRQKEQKDRVRIRAMFDMYNDVNNSKKHLNGEAESDIDESGSEYIHDGTADAQQISSPITPANKTFVDISRSPVNGSGCNIVGCIQPNKSVTNAENGNYGHCCTTCGAAVHLLCCLRVLGIAVEDSETPLYCSKCFK